MMCGGAPTTPLSSPVPSSSSRFVDMTSRASELRRMIVDLNNRAIECLKEQKNQEASRILTDGLCILDAHGACYRFYSSGALPASYHHHHSRGTDPLLPLSSCCPRGSRGMRRPMNVRLPERKEQDNLPTAIYNRAFLLNEDDPMNINVDIAVLAFNNALSYHLQGIASCDSHESKQQALFWYYEAHQRLLIDELSAPSRLPLFHCGLHDREYSRSMILLAAAVCHNMAAILGDDFWDFGNARLLRCQLAQLIHCEGHRFSQLDTDDFVFFHLVIFFAIIDDFRIAPAA